ncbi:MAG: hypothetical protein QMD04_05490 [Anaerolineales bacterium]|nr:hypothetical protein [Anaerolineales bacterium]
MPSPEQDLAFLRAGIQELTDYLLSGELYWPLTPGAAGVPRLTIGGLLLAQARLQARRPSSAAQVEMAALEGKMDAVRTKWRSAWERKAGREVHARLELWRNYLSDYRDSPENHAHAYPHEVQWRVMLGLLSGEFAFPTKKLDSLSSLDAILKAEWLPGEFVWDADLTTAFPQPEYWYLYGKLKRSVNV